ncbi:unnamed protein product [Camellia sinensis]
MNGAFLEDATVVSCGHSFGGQLLRKVLETQWEVKESRCNLCSAEIDTSSLIPNYALRAAAAAVKHEDDRRLFHNAALRKRRKEMGDQMHMVKRQNRPQERERAEIEGFEISVAKTSLIISMVIDIIFFFGYGGGSVGLMGLISQAVYDGDRHVLGEWLEDTKTKGTTKQCNYSLNQPQQPHWHYHTRSSTGDAEVPIFS